LRYKAYHIKEYIEGPIFNTFVAEINKEIIGVVLIIIFKKAKYLYVENLIVKKEFRKSGVASNLESYVENIAKKNKLNLIYFYSEENNKAMAKLSKKLKFIEGKKWSFFWKEIK
jgi:N-acetylglutamate synthase-like GNAT family acetyltransferase